MDAKGVPGGMTGITGIHSERSNGRVLQSEVVVIPVADVDRAKAFYKQLGWREDADLITGDDFRALQLAPPGLASSVIFGTGITSAVPGPPDG